ncbi:MAG: long-chain fatty acid--CoA ligase [Thermoanaerobaculia bacterium]
MIHGDLLGERTRLTPEKTALVDVATGRRFTYGELDARAMRAARALTSRLGLATGDRVALLSGNRVEFLDLFFACGKSGAVLVPLNTRLAVLELQAILEDADPKALIFETAFEETAEDLLRKCPGVEAVCLDAPAAPAQGRFPTFEEKLLGLSPDEAAWCGALGAPRPGPEDLYCLLYTSGTTGKPKGVMLPHRMVSWNGLNTAICWGLREDDVSPIYTPLYHAGGLGAFLTPILAAGGTIVLHRGFDPAEILATIEREGCTVVLGVPTTWRMLLESPSFASTDFSRVRWFISGGAPLPLDLIEAYQKRGVVFKQGYGLTEVGVNCFSMTKEESVRKAGSIGKPMMFTEARLVDEAGKDVADDEVGELLLRGPHVSRGYWRNPEATAAALDPGGWFHTGDVARRDGEGFYTIAGRRKEMFISGGVNVYPAEIEGVLFQYAGVKDVAVVGVPHPTWGEVGVAFVVKGGAVSATDLTAFLKTRLARFKIPRDFVFVDSLPRTPYGKVVKSELQASYLPNRPSSDVPE